MNALKTFFLSSLYVSLVIRTSHRFSSFKEACLMMPEMNSGALFEQHQLNKPDRKCDPISSPPFKESLQLQLRNILQHIQESC